MPFALRNMAVDPPPRPLGFNPEDVVALDRLRLVAARTRCAAQVDPTALCSLLSTDRSVEAMGYAEGLLRILPLGIGRKLVFYKAGETACSDDEAWLLRALTCARDGDEESLTFLLRSRISRMFSRQIAFLMRNLASRLDCLSNSSTYYAGSASRDQPTLKDRKGTLP